MKIKDIWREISIFLFSIFLRLPRLGTDIFNADVFRWKARSYSFSSGLFGFDFAQTAQTSHPGVVLMWLGTVGIKVYSGFNRLFRSSLPSGDQQIFELHFVQKFVVVIVFAVLFALAFYLLRNLTNTSIAFFSVLLLTLEPHFLAHTRIFHLDALLSMFMFVSVLCFLLSLRAGNSPKPGFKTGPNRAGGEGKKLSFNEFFQSLALWNSPPVYLILSAIFAGFALLTKVIALFLIPFTVLIIFIFSTGDIKHRFVSTLRITSCWLLITAATFVVFWPAMWVQPAKTVQLYFTGVTLEGFGGHRNYFFGQWATNPGPTFYLMSLWIRLSPWLLGLVIFGLIFYTVRIFRSVRQEKEFEANLGGSSLVSVFFLFVVFFYVFIAIPSKKLERYSLPLYPALAVLGGVALYQLKKTLSNWLEKLSHGFLGFKQFLISKLSIVLGILLFIAFLFSTNNLFPDYLAYRSPLAGGLEGTVGIIRPDWVFGAWRVGEFFNSSELRTTPVIYTYNPWQFQPFLPGYVRDTEDAEGLSTADYVILPVWSERNLEIDSDLFELIKVVKVNGAPVYNVYQPR